MMSWSDTDSFTVDFLRCLPQNLQTLRIPQRYFKVDIDNPPNDLNSIIEVLPRTLTTLDTCFSAGYGNKPCFDISKFPSNFSNLTTNAYLDEKTYHMIPKSLKSLVLYNQTYNIDKLAPFLPAGLEKLSITIDDNPPTSERFAHLSNLQNLSLEPEAALQLDDLSLNDPTTLESLTLRNIVLTVPNRLFNNNLTKLELIYVYGTTAELMSSLPQSLTEFKIFDGTMEEPSFAYFGLLPKGLKLLHTNLDVVENISLLPESLASLRLNGSKPINVSYCDRLPPKLESLEINQSLPQSMMKQLPESLTDFCVTADEFVDDEVVRKLPRGLKRFYFNGPDMISDAGAADLPAHITTLFLSQNTRLTDNAIGSLPRGLLYLALPRNKNFTDKCIKSLPPRLTSLEMDKARKITSKSCKDLPRYLRVLALPDCNDWDPEMLIKSKNELPKFIRTIRLGKIEAADAWKKLLKERGSD